MGFSRRRLSNPDIQSNSGPQTEGNGSMEKAKTGSCGYRGINLQACRAQRASVLNSSIVVKQEIGNAKAARPETALLSGVTRDQRRRV
jgi:hypothetical protein